MTLMEIDGPQDLYFFPTLIARRTRADLAGGIHGPTIRVFGPLERLFAASRIVGSWCEAFCLAKDAAATIQQSTVHRTMLTYFRAESDNYAPGCTWCSGYLEAHSYLRRKCLRPNGLLTVADLLEAHRRLLAGQKLGRRMAGYLRTAAVEAVDAAYGPQQHAPEAAELPAAVGKLMAFIKSSRELAPVDRVAVAHAELMLLRPFQVGNMRLAHRASESKCAINA